MQLCLFTVMADKKPAKACKAELSKANLTAIADEDTSSWQTKQNGAQDKAAIREAAPRAHSVNAY